MAEFRPADTSAGAWEITRAAHARLGPEGRLQAAFQASEFVRAIAREGIRARHPGYDDRGPPRGAPCAVFGPHDPPGAWKRARPVHDKRELRRPPSGQAPTFLRAVNGFQILPVHLRHALRVSTLPDHHGDPFDRILVAQAQIENLVLVSGDEQIARYPVTVAW